MTGKDTHQIAFRVDTARVLKIISSEIYDSSLALLRENVQNAYDAILMRAALGSGFQVADGVIDIRIGDDQIHISDNGIGMTESVLAENFWKAGSSGKRSEFARKAGVVGTFGIGAMANFGVCSRLVVSTRSVDSEKGVQTVAERDKLSLNEDCIELSTDHDREIGTEVTVTLDPQHPIAPEAAKAYLAPYVKHIPIATRINGQLVSQQGYRDQIIAGDRSELSTRMGEKEGDLTADVSVLARKSGQIIVTLSSVKVGDGPVRGEAVLAQGEGHTFALRNSFGLAPAPIASHYQFGGIANFDVLHPTAGREALSRESIDFLNRLIRLGERVASEVVAETDVADRNSQFAAWLVAHGRYDLAGRITIDVAGQAGSIPLAEVSALSKVRQVAWFRGRDRGVVDSYAGGDTMLFLVAQTNPRHQVQMQWLLQHSISEVPDTVTVLQTFSPAELSIGEVGLLLRIASVIADDYLVPDPVVKMVKLSHGAPMRITVASGQLEALLNREAGELRPLVQCYHDAIDVFGGFVRDFVRVRLYPQFASAVPSATREGAEALRKALQRKRELYRYEAEDLGGIESLISDYIEGKSTFSSVIASIGAQSPHVQRITQESVGRAEEEIGGITQMAQAQGAPGQFGPSPPILRRESETTSKLLTVGGGYDLLNGVKLFLSLSERAARQELDFFLQPHSTKVVWGSHRVLYIFGDASGGLTFYYDIETKEALRDTVAGGKGVPTTTVITSNRIYVPIPEELVSSFTIQSGAKELYVRYDYITG